MVSQNLCPKCGSRMDLSNIFSSGKAKCQCGYEGMPLTDSEYAKKMLKQASERTGESRDPLNIKGLAGKLAIIFVGILAMSVSMPEMHSVIPVSVLGLLIFAAGYKLI